MGFSKDSTMKINKRMVWISFYPSDSYLSVFME